MVQRIGTAHSATPHPDPCGGQAPALHFLIPPSAISLRFGTFRRWRAGVEVDWRAYPGPESGACFHCSRSCRLGPAQQGMKSWSCGLVRRIGAAVSAAPLLRPSGGQAPALHFPIPTPLDSSLRWNDGISRGSLSRIVVRDMLSLQSLVPAGSGTPRFQKPVL